MDQDVDVDSRSFGKPEIDRIALDGAGQPEKAPEIRQCPAERTERIVGLREEQLR